MTYKAAAPIIARESPEAGFELLGFDFMIDSDLNVYLIEVNQNPCLATLCDQQKLLISSLVTDTLSLAVDPLYGLDQTKVEIRHTEDPAGYSTRYQLVYAYCQSQTSAD